MGLSLLANSRKKTTMSDSIVCMKYPNCDQEHAAGLGGVPIHPPAESSISGTDGPLIPGDDDDE